MGYKQKVTPNLDELAEKAVVFDRNYAMASYTGKSIGPMLIGKYPSETLRDGAHFTVYSEENVFTAERLKEAGVHTMGCASFWYFQRKFGLPQGIDDWDMSAMPSAVQADTDTSITSEQLTDAAIKQLEKNGGTRFFQWVHYFDPHAQYMGHQGAPNFWTGKDQDKWAKYAYDGELWFTDKHVGRLLDYVASQPWGKRHGHHRDRRPRRGVRRARSCNFHGTDLWEPLVRVPLVIYVPGVTAPPCAGEAQPHRPRADHAGDHARPPASCGDALGGEPDEGRPSRRRGRDLRRARRLHRHAGGPHRSHAAMRSFTGRRRA